MSADSQRVAGRFVIQTGVSAPRLCPLGRLRRAHDDQSGSAWRLLDIPSVLVGDISACRKLVEQLQAQSEKSGQYIIYPRFASADGDRIWVGYLEQDWQPDPEATDATDGKRNAVDVIVWAKHLALAIEELHQDGILHGIIAPPATSARPHHSLRLWGGALAPRLDRKELSRRARESAASDDMAYASEVLLGEAIGPSADIFGWASSVAAHWLGTSSREALVRLRGQHTREPASVDLYNLVQRCLSACAEEQEFTASELVRELESLQQRHGPKLEQAPRPVHFTPTGLHRVVDSGPAFPNDVTPALGLGPLEAETPAKSDSRAKERDRGNRPATVAGEIRKPPPQPPSFMPRTSDGAKHKADPTPAPREVDGERKTAPDSAHGHTFDDFKFAPARSSRWPRVFAGLGALTLLVVGAWWYQDELVALGREGGQLVLQQSLDPETKDDPPPMAAPPLEILGQGPQAGDETDGAQAPLGQVLVVDDSDKSGDEEPSLALGDENTQEAPSEMSPPSPPEAVLESCPDDSVQIESRACMDRFEYPGRSRMPQTAVSWQQAQSLCAARRGRLCRPDEWNLVCTQKEVSPYCLLQKSRRRAAKVRLSQPSECVQPGGIYDMVGNVAEWLEDGSVHGGDSATPRAEASCATVVAKPPEQGDSRSGFRCCYDLKPKP